MELVAGPDGREEPTSRELTTRQGPSRINLGTAASEGRFPFTRGIQ
jgi:hypothetical protein